MNGIKPGAGGGGCSEGVVALLLQALRFSVHVSQLLFKSRRAFLRSLCRFEDGVLLVAVMQTLGL